MIHETQRCSVGQVVGVFGIKGWIKVKSDTQPQINITRYEPWWLRTSHGLKMFELEAWEERPKGLVVKLKDIDDRDAALALGKATIDVQSDQFESLPEGEYYWSQLIGLRVHSEFGSQSYDFGQVDKLIETGSNDVLIVKDANGRERLVPYLPGEFVKSIDLDRGLITVEWDPEF